MGIWSAYEDRLSVHGSTKQSAAKNRELRFINSHLPDNLSYCSVSMFLSQYGFNIDSDLSQSNKVTKNVSIINSENMNEKIIISMPDDDIELGALVYWMDNYWLVYERDVNTTLYTKAKMLQCNHLLKWITTDNEIIKQWCVVEDGTSYMSGESEVSDFVATKPDSRISVRVAKNAYTVLLNRESRFLIDDDDSPRKLSYSLTKPLKSGLTYNGKGTFKFILQEVVTTEYDNHELGIADYYLHFPSKENTQGSVTGTTATGKKVWL